MSGINIEKLYKSYGKKAVLKDVKLNIPLGEISGMLGLNGAGKTTFFNCITGLTDSNLSEYFKTKQEFSYMSKPSIYDFQSLREIIYINECLLKNFDKSVCEIMLNECKIPIKKSYGSFSLGQKNLIDFILAMSRRCKYYLLDEPLSNVDILHRKFIKDTVIDKSSNENIIIISTHDTESLENIFSGICVLHNGKISPYIKTETLREQGKSVTEYYKEIINV